MIITKMSLPRRTVPARAGRDGGAAAARRDGAGPVGAVKTAARPAMRLGFVYVPNGDS